MNAATPQPWPSGSRMPPPGIPPAAVGCFGGDEDDDEGLKALSQLVDWIGHESPVARRSAAQFIGNVPTLGQFLSRGYRFAIRIRLGALVKLHRVWRELDDVPSDPESALYMAGLKERLKARMLVAIHEALLLAEAARDCFARSGEEPSFIARTHAFCGSLMKRLES